MIYEHKFHDLQKQPTEVFYWKKTSAQVFSSEFYQKIYDTLFHGKSPVAASVQDRVNLKIIIIYIIYYKNMAFLHTKIYFWYWYFQSITSRSNHTRCSVKKAGFRNYTKFTGKHPCQSLFLNKKKETLAQVFFCKFCDISKNNFS